MTKQKPKPVCVIGGKRTSIVATLGPASESREVLTEMIRNGMNVTRFNMSHGEHEWDKEVMERVRSIAKQEKRHVGILADLQGPRIRTIVEKDIVIKSGETIALTDITQNDERIPVGTVIKLDCPHITPLLLVGHNIMIEDGLMRMIVTAQKSGYVLVKVIDGGTVKNHKGVNVPDGEVPLPTLTNKDKKDLTFALAQGIDFVALSFVRTADDVLLLRRRMRKILGDNAQLPRIIVKIERKEAIANLDAIVHATDAVMVARGDLGIEVSPAGVALLQKDIIKASMALARPVIVATQMLQSMVDNARPTRAEVSDVTNAVIDHADAVMLSAETTIGKDPVNVIATMTKIIEQTEASTYDDVIDTLDLAVFSDQAMIARGAHELARELDAKAIVLFSETGQTARLIAHYRGERHVLVATNNERTYNQLALVWSTICYKFRNFKNRRTYIDHITKAALKDKLLAKGDTIVVVLGNTEEGKQMQLFGSRVIE